MKHSSESRHSTTELITLVSWCGCANRWPHVAKHEPCDHSQHRNVTGYLWPSNASSPLEVCETCNIEYSPAVREACHFIPAIPSTVWSHSNGTYCISCTVNGSCSKPRSQRFARKIIKNAVPCTYWPTVKQQPIIPKARMNF